MIILYKLINKTMNKIKTNPMKNTLFHRMENDLKLYIDNNNKNGQLDIIVKSNQIYFKNSVNDKNDLLFILFDNFINKRKLKETINLIIAIVSESETKQDDKVIVILFDNEDILFKIILDKY